MWKKDRNRLAGFRQADYGLSNHNQTHINMKTIEITIGGIPALELLKMLRDKHACAIHTNEAEDYLFGCLETHPEPKKLRFAIVSGQELGAPEVDGFVAYRDVFDAAINTFKFGHCPPESAAHFCLQHELEKGQNLHFGMEWLTCKSGRVRIFGVNNYHDEKPQSLGSHGYNEGPATEIKADALWVFALQS